jgi:sterol desaturase/sphingolipid hydroxylase (fatty acid hydroxylase superfamily)
MEILKILLDEITGFLGINPLIDIIHSGNYSSLKTLDGLTKVVGPVIPILLFFELGRALFLGRFKRGEYRIAFFIYIFNRVVSKFISIAAIGFFIALLEPHHLLTTTFTWYWLIYGYIVWELAHFVYHYLGHKVRIFWCLHATHHTPEHMNLSVSQVHFFLEGPYADAIRTSICILLGVSPPLLFVIMFIDGTWGGFIHAGEHLMKDGRMGFLNKILLTPSHHRVHHARNPLYMDTNFCNLLNIWDRIFKTHQQELPEILPEYGVTRKINSQNFTDVYFGEFIELAKDIWHAPGITNKLLYVVMPPGWSHTGNHKLASEMRKNYRAEMQHHLQNKEQTTLV